MQFSIVFKSIDDKYLTVTDEYTGWRAVANARKDSGVPRLSPDVVRGAWGRSDMYLRTELKPGTAESLAKALYLANEVTVYVIRSNADVPPLNQFCRLVPHVEKSDETGEVNEVRYAWDIDWDRLLEAYRQDGQPDEWTPRESYDFSGRPRDDE
jgi:hypothetical protein